MPRVIARLVGGAPWTEPLFPDHRSGVDGVQTEVRTVASFELLVDTPQYHDPDYVLTGVAGARLSLDGTTFGDVGADLPVAVSSTPRVVWIQVARGEVDAPTLVVPVGNCVLDEGDPKAGGVVASQSSIVGSVRRIVPVSGIVTSESAVVGAARKQTEYPLVEGTVFSSSALVGSVRRIVPVSGVVGMLNSVVGSASKAAAPAGLTGTFYLRSDTVTVNGFTGSSLGTENTTVAAVLRHDGYLSILYASIRVLKRTAGGVETVVSDWVQAQVSLDTTGDVGFGIETSAVYAFPGISSMDATDSLIIQLGLHNASGGTPTLTKKFTTAQLGVTSLLAATWTVYYFLSYVNDDDVGIYVRDVEWGGPTRPSRIVMV